MDKKPQKPKSRKLTKEEKKAVWSKPETNAGAGWQSRRDIKTTLNQDWRDYDEQSS